MGTTLTGTTPQDTYDSLIKVTDNGPLSGTAKYLSDGLGNDSALALSTGNIGIGTNAPSNDLTLSKSVAAGNVVLQIENTSTTGSARLWFGNNANTAGARIQYFGATHAQRPNLFSIGTDAANDVMFETTGAERMRITSAGNVGIGTNAPYTSLTIGTSDATAEISSGGSNTHLTLKTVGASGALRFFTIGGGTSTLATTETMRITADGYMRMAASTGGIQFNGDTAAANALDDYEEGTFNPAPVGTANVSNFAAITGKYTKIGNVVNFNISFLADVASSTAESVVDITLPFGAYSTSNKCVGHVGVFSGTGADRFGVGSVFLGTTSNSIVNIYIAANQMNASGTGIEFRASYTYFV